MNIFRLWWLKWYYRKESNVELMLLLDLSIKAGRRVTHDLGHCVSCLGMAEYRLGEEQGKRHSYKDRYKERQEMWKKIFYPLNGMKNYRNQLHNELMDKDVEINRLKQLCIDNNIDPTDPNEIPF